MALTLHKNRTHTVTDGGFVFHNRRAVLMESAQSFDRALRIAGAHGEGSQADPPPFATAARRPTAFDPAVGQVVRDVFSDG